MPDLFKLAQATLGSMMPIGFSAAGSYGVIRFGRYPDTHLKSGTRDAYVDYLRKGA